MPREKQSWLTESETDPGRRDMMPDVIKAACVQVDSRPGDVKGNIEKSLGLIKEAKDGGAQLVVLPELFNVGYDFSVLEGLRYDYDETRSLLSMAAKEIDIHIAAGLLEIEDGKRYNSVLVFDPGGFVSTKYRKICLFPPSREEKVFHPGGELATFSIGNLKFGIMICFDIRFPEISRKYYKEGCSCLIVSSAFPFPRLDHWRILLRSRAVENQMYVVAANRVGKDGPLYFMGNSCIIDPWGTVKAIANETEETVIMGDIVAEKIDEVRKTIPCGDGFQRVLSLLT